MPHAIDFTELKQRVSIERAAEMLGIKTTKSGAQRRGTCPICKAGGDRAFVLTPAKGLNCALKPRHNKSVTWPFSEATCQIIGCVYFRRRSRRMSSDVWSLARPWRRFRRNWGLPGSYCMNGVGRGVAMAQPD